MLICIRRFFAVLLIPFFLVLFLSTMLVLRVNATVLEADFYTDALRDLDLYNFVYDEGLPFAIETAEREGGFTLDSLPLGIELTPQSVSARISQVLPPAWLEENVSTVIDSGVPYITGATDSFSITITVDDRVEAAADVFKEMLLEADVHSFLVDDFIQQQLDQAIVSLPYGLTLTKQQITAGIIEVVPQDWLKEQVAGVLDEVTPYLVGKKDTFAVTIPLDERALSAIAVVEGWLLTSLEGGAYDYLLEEQIAPVVRSALGAVVVLPYGVTITNEEILDALATVLPPQWIAERVSEALDAIGPYIVADTDTFLLTIPLADRAELAAPTLVDVVDSKFESVYTSLPICTLGQLSSLTLSLDELPPCRPPLVTYDQLKDLVGLDVLDELVQAFVQPLPDEITVNEQILFAALGTQYSGYLDTVRELLSEGYTFTEQDLITLIEDQSATPAEAADNVELFQDIRSYLRDGFTFSNTDIESQIGNSAELATFNDVRGYIDTGRTLLWLLIILPVAIAIAIGFLGGRRWGTRLAWAGVPVVIAGVITAIALGPVASYGFEVADDSIRRVDINGIFIARLLDARVAMEDSFVSPMATQSMAVAAIGFGMIVVGLFVLGRSRST